MQELWLCEGCKSINRAQSGRCSSCGSERPAVAPIIEAAAPGVVELSRPGAEPPPAAVGRGSNGGGRTD